MLTFHGVIPVGNSVRAAAAGLVFTEGLESMQVNFRAKRSGAGVGVPCARADPPPAAVS